MSALRDLLGETGAYQEGHFQLSPAQHVLSYYSCEKLFQYPALASRAADHLFECVRDVGADFIVTPSISSLMLAFELSRRTSWQLVLHDRPFTSADYRFPRGTRILVVEDVVVSGKSLAHAQRWCAERHGEIIGYGVLVDRRPHDFARDDVPLYAALRDPVAVYAPDDCPACHDRIPLRPVPANYPQRVA